MPMKKAPSAIDSPANSMANAAPVTAMKTTALKTSWEKMRC